MYNVRDADIRAYEEDGVVCLREVVPPAECRRMLQAGLNFANNGPPQTNNFGRQTWSTKGGRYFQGNSMWKTEPVFRDFALRSALPGVASKIMRAKVVRLYYDQLFVIDPGTGRATTWHNDLTFWPFEGADIVSLWLALTPIRADNSPLEYLAGSHKDKTLYQPEPMDGGELFSDTLPVSPDYSDPKVRGDRRVLWWEMEPGDVLVHHPYVLHGARANTSAENARCALSIRYLGDDVRYAPKPGAPLKRAYNCTPGSYPADDENLPLVGIA